MRSIIIQNMKKIKRAVPVSRGGRWQMADGRSNVALCFRANGLAWRSSR
jgi:hypothetical protein